jgi:hypoxia up-regulated 1
MVRAAVKDFISEDKIAQNVNSDEAAVLGAAFYGATQSRQFKTKEYRVADLTASGVEVAYATEGNSERTIRTELFKTGAKTGRRKTLKVKRSDDFDLAARYSAGVKQSVDSHA